MNRKNRHERNPLDLCPVCGMDSGERVQSTDAPFKHYVQCSTCGAITAGYAQQSNATKAWKRGDAWNAFDDVAPGFLINGECCCPECAKDWLKDEVDSDPEAVARAMGIAIIDIPED